ncbi:NAD(P)/FAD-dependent oxidoreductase [Patescibacteria group bacterium]|nr:NAD(P)/FAD-dependent oxidoreductase [Patescibacteria group bacterium]
MKIAVIGGGAAGLMAAATIKEAWPKVEVIIIEKNSELGKKVVISGGGRCNLTTGLDDIKLTLSKYPRGDKFLTKAMYAFPPKSVREWFINHGVPVKTEKDMRVFPVSNNGHDVVDVFKNIFTKIGAEVLLDSPVEDIKKTKKGFSVKIKNLNKTLAVDKVILTTGGQAYRQTGSTGDGYNLSAKLGHNITELAPSLSAFYTKETWPAEVAGLSIQDATLKIKINKKKLVINGPLMFTHKGITGPAVFAMSALIAFEKIDTKTPLKIFIDIFSGTKESELTSELNNLMDKHYKKTVSRVLSMLVPKSLALIILSELGIDPLKESGQVGKTDKALIINWMKQIPLNIVARVAGEEFVTAGGVDLDEVNPSTMESKKCPGLYLAGEILNIDGFTGGFNLQSAWATGRIAGISVVAKKIIT